jgi:hypothetical protein
MSSLIASSCVSSPKKALKKENGPASEKKPARQAQTQIVLLPGRLSVHPVTGVPPPVF